MASLRIVLWRVNRRTTYTCKQLFSQLSNYLISQISEATYQTAVSRKLPYSKYIATVLIYKNHHKNIANTCINICFYEKKIEISDENRGKSNCSNTFNLSKSQIHIHVPALSSISLSIVSISSGIALSLLIRSHLNSFTHYIFLIQNLLVRSCHFFDFCLNYTSNLPFRSLLLQHLFQLELRLKPTLFLTVNIVFMWCILFKYPCFVLNSKIRILLSANAPSQTCFHLSSFKRTKAAEYSVEIENY